MAGVASTVFTSTWIGRELFALGRKMASQPGTMTPRKHIKKRTKRASPSPATSHRVESEYSNGDVSCSCSDNEYDYHEKVVDDINLRFFYQPRTLTLLFCIVVLLVYFAFVRDDSVSQENNVFAGLLCVAFWFIPVSLLCFPNGPFVRPHPAVWRIVCGVCFAYQLLLSFSLFQTYDDVRGFLVKLYPDLSRNHSDSTQDYAADCSLTWANVMSRFDFFIIAHLLGYVVKAMLLRHAGLVWFISIMWEITEMAFMHVLPNFAECWWDIIFMDVLLCNGVGIHLGIYICKKLEMKTFHWASVKDIRTAGGKIRRIFMQFTPASWAKVRWSECGSPFSRFCAILIIIFLFQINELNIFVFKHLFVIPSSHPLLFFHHGLLVLSSAPAVRQYYLYVTDRNRQRIGTQFWFFIANTLTETLFNLKFGKDLIRHTYTPYFIAWLLIQVGLSMFAVFLIVYMASPNGAFRRQLSQWRSKRRCSSAGSESGYTKQIKSQNSSTMIDDSSSDESEDDNGVQRRRVRRKS